MKVLVTPVQARALKRFRLSEDAPLIKELLLRELQVSREQFEAELADEGTRQYIMAVKTILATLFDNETTRETG